MMRGFLFAGIAVSSATESRFPSLQNQGDFYTGIFTKIEAKDKLQKLYDKLKVNEEYFKDELLLISKAIKEIE